MEILPNSGAHDAVQAFDFNGLTLRALLVEGEPWFIGVDACNALELKNSRDALGRLDPDDVGNADVIDSLGRTQKMKTVTEAGLYQLIFQSRTGAAQAFKRWVTHDVLPAIRRTGSYAVEKQPETALEWAEKFIETEKARLALAEENKALAPKAEVYDKILTPEHTFGFRDLCKSLREHFPINEADVKRVLRAKKILTPARVLGRDRMDVYSAAIDRGWAVRHPAGTHGGKERFQVRFTNQTLEWLLAELAPLEEVA